MILLFLGSWRSTLIVLISIPLSILTSIVVLYFMGHTLNTMTSAAWRWRSASWSTIPR
jgi:multidrug efflux pump subunit AcrB